jgi:ABC-type nickel/cobalt efflux system permease component RcnA
MEWITIVGLALSILAGIWAVWRSVERQIEDQAAQRKADINQAASGIQKQVDMLSTALQHHLSSPALHRTDDMLAGQKLERELVMQAITHIAEMNVEEHKAIILRLGSMEIEIRRIANQK